MYHRKMTEWKMIAPEKGRILLDWKMAENVPPENDGMENDCPEKRRNSAGPDNGGKYTPGKCLPREKTEWKMTSPEKGRIL